MTNLAIKRESNLEDLFDFRRNFDHIFNRFLAGSTSPSERSRSVLAAVPPIEAWIERESNKYHLNIALPGVDPKDLQVNLQGNTLTVSGEHRDEQEKKDADYLQREFSYGRFERMIVIPEGVDANKLTAEYNNGVLEVTAPLNEAALPKRIEIKSPVKAKGVGA